jgi:hypothetical protein
MPNMLFLQTLRANVADFVQRSLFDRTRPASSGKVTVKPITSR